MPIVVLTLTPKPGAPGLWDDRALYTLAGNLRSEMAKIDDVGITFIAGGQREAIRVVPDPRAAGGGAGAAVFADRGHYPGWPQLSRRHGPRK